MNQLPNLPTGADDVSNIFPTLNPQQIEQLKALADKYRGDVGDGDNKVEEAAKDPKTTGNSWFKKPESEEEDAPLIKKVTIKPADIEIDVTTHEPFFPKGTEAFELVTRDDNKFRMVYDPRTGVIYNLNQVLRLGYTKSDGWYELDYYGPEDIFLDFTLASSKTMFYPRRDFENLNHIMIGRKIQFQRNAYGEITDMYYDSGVSLAFRDEERAKIEVVKVFLDEGGPQFELLKIINPIGRIPQKGLPKDPYPLSVFTREDDPWEVKMLETSTGMGFSIYIPSSNWVIDGSFSLRLDTSFFSMMLNGDLRPIIPVRLGINKRK